MNRKFSIILPLFLLGICAPDIIIDQDGSCDDFTAILLVMLDTPELIQAITVVPGDSFLRPNAWITLEMIKRYMPAKSLSNVKVGITDNEGVHPFPDMWREDSWNIARLPVWHDEEALMGLDLGGIPSAVDVLTYALEQASEPVRILATGALTNLADVLIAHPGLASKIERVFFMGGAIFIEGNLIVVPDHADDAEWNVYNNPQSLLDVLQAHVPITIVPLDATQYAPISKGMLSEMKRLGEKGYPQFDISYKILNVEGEQIEEGTYFFWDTLTSLAFVLEHTPEELPTTPLRVNVVVDPTSRSEGRVYLAAEDFGQVGYPVDAILTANTTWFEEQLLKILHKGDWLNNKNSKKKLPGWGIALIVVFIVLIVGVVILILVCVGVYVSKKQKGPSAGTYKNMLMK